MHCISLGERLLYGVINCSGNIGGDLRKRKCYFNETVNLPRTSTRRSCTRPRCCHFRASPHHETKNYNRTIEDLGLC